MSSNPFEKISSDIIRLSLLKTNTQDIINFCQTTKESQRVCSSFFWQTVAQQKLKIYKLGEYKTWRKLVVDTNKRKNLTEIGKRYLKGDVTKNEAQRLIKNFLGEGTLIFKNKPALEHIKKVIKDDIKSKYREISEQLYYDPYYDPDEDTDPIELAIQYDIYVYYNVNSNMFTVFNHEVNQDRFLEVIDQRFDFMDEIEAKLIDKYKGEDFDF